MSKRLSCRAAVLAASVGLGAALGYLASQFPSPGARAALAAPQPPASPPKAAKVERFGSVIGLKPEKAEEYIRLHANTWPGVLATIRKCNIRNYSIYLGELDDGRLYLFSYFEYTGDDFQADMDKMAADPTTQRWWKLTDPCQIPQKNRKKGEHWMRMREVFHTD
ncbi:MAG: L-rhamnose mutarotase [Thermoguttaceae bacterium]